MHCVRQLRSRLQACSNFATVRRGPEESFRRMKSSRIASQPLQDLDYQPRVFQFADSNVVDMRSDTVTHPTMEMRRAILEAPVGDDCYNEDPTVNFLQETVAKKFGKEAALLVPTGVMANLIAMMVFCDTRSSEALLGEYSHQMIYEQGGMATVACVHPRTLTNLPDGTFDLEEVESKIRGSYSYEPTTRVICVENTQNYIGGRVIRPSYMEELYSITKKHGVPIYVDGARIMNASVALGIPPAEFLVRAEAAAIGVAKGLAAPLGALLLGTKDFIKRAYKIRKVLGGGMRQAGIIAAPALVALEQMPKSLHQDHVNAKILAQKLTDFKSLGLDVDPSTVDTNMVMFTVKGATVKEMIQLMATPMSDDGGQYIVKMFDNGKTVRAVTHYHISPKEIDKAVEKVGVVLRMLKKQRPN